MVSTGVDQGDLYSIIMEYADNGDVFQKISKYQKNRVKFDEDEIWKVFIQIVRGLKALHDMKIMHRDLKTANLFLYKDSGAKLGDMNVSKVMRQGLSYTQTGTPYYASPEVWKDKPYDFKSDIWSLGCCLYEMITLKPPFKATDMKGLYKKVVRGVYPKISNQFSHDIQSVVKMMVVVDPKKRPDCDQILKCKIVKRKIELYALYTDEELMMGDNSFLGTENNELLNTIYVPKNLMSLTDRLPKPNYAGSS